MKHIPDILTEAAAMVDNPELKAELLSLHNHLIKAQEPCESGLAALEATNCGNAVGLREALERVGLVERKKVEPWERVREALTYDDGHPVISDAECRRAAAAATEGHFDRAAITDAIERVAAHRETVPTSSTWWAGYKDGFARAIALLRKELGL